MYIWLYVLCVFFRFLGLAAELFLTIFVRIIEFILHKSLRQYIKVENMHSIINNKHDWGMCFYWSHYMIFGNLFAIFCPFNIWFNLNVLPDFIQGIGSELITLFLWCYIADKFLDYLYEEPKYRKKFNEYDKKSVLWKILWSFIVFVFGILSTLISMVISVRLLN